MIEYSQTNLPETDFSKIGKDGWILSCIYEGVCYFHRVKPTTRRKSAETGSDINSRFFSMFKDGRWIIKTETEILQSIVEKCRLNVNSIEGIHLLEEFANYWMESDQKGNQKWQKQSTFDIFARIRTFMNKPAFRKQDTSKIVEERRKQAMHDEQMREQEEMRKAEAERMELRKIFASLSKEKQEEIKARAVSEVKALNITKNVDVLVKGKIAAIVKKEYFNK